MDLILQVLALQSNSSVLGKEPISPFVILLLVILVIPILFEKLRLPGLVGLVCSGVALGPFGANLLPHTQSPMMNLLSEIGLFYLMFVAGLEIEIKQFRSYKNRFLGFGSLTFAVPLMVGILIGYLFGFNWNQAILIGSVLASHTILAYPILNRLGIARNEVVNVTTGATVVTNIGAVLLLAICVANRGDSFNFWQLINLINALMIYCLIVLVGLDCLGKEFFRRSGEDEGNQFLFVLWTVFLAAAGAQLIGVEKIVGAFLAGLTVHNVIGSGPVKEKVIFLGSALFIPIFFVNLGLLVNINTLMTSMSMVWFTIFVIVGLIISKLIAALLAKLVYRYNWQEMLTMWSLSVPQVGVTLAATLVGYRSGLLDINLFNSMIILVIVTCILGPLITNQVAVGLRTAPTPEPELTASAYPVPKENGNPFTIVVPIYNPQTQQYLIEMAALLAHQTHGQIIPLAIATAAAQMDAPQLENSLHRSEQLLAKAVGLSQVLDVEAKPLLRIDDAFAQGISRAAREQKANLIVMGWGKRTGLRARLFGNVIDSVIWSSHCPVAVTRLVESPQKIQRILVPVENLLAPSLYPVHFAQILAETNQAQVTVLNVCERRTSSSKITWRRSQLSLFVSQLALPNPPEIQIIAHDNVAQAILQAARLYDLVVLPFTRNRTNTGGLTISDVTSQLANQITCSIVMLGEPHNPQTMVLSPYAQVISKK
ncbi:cation:proton antiporter [Calothrix rhizosoleniae]|uniref:cation:proton antiporter domain-containing protein n=1 Tax=Calothrix rhizosoleniae TaxID=888997 RepID=UPI000B4A3BDF|nr:cation:proton antiporter [Calothrix rhizosoleniae]